MITLYCYQRLRADQREFEYIKEKSVWANHYQIIYHTNPNDTLYYTEDNEGDCYYEAQKNH